MEYVGNVYSPCLLREQQKCEFIIVGHTIIFYMCAALLYITFFESKLFVLQILVDFYHIYCSNLLLQMCAN